MLKKILALIFLGSLYGFPTTTNAQSLDMDIDRTVTALKQRLGDGWIIELNKEKTRVVHIEKDIDLPAEKQARIPALSTPADTARSPGEVAMAFLRDNASFFNLQTDLHDLHVEQRIGSAKEYVDIHQTYNGLPVISEIGVNIGLLIFVDPTKGIESISSNYLPNINIPITPILSKNNVIAIAKEDTLRNRLTTTDKYGKRHPVYIKKNTNHFGEAPNPKLAICVIGNEEPVLVYKFHLTALDNLIHTSYIINANTGDILRAIDSRMYAYDGLGTGKVFWPNPVNSLKNTALRDNLDKDSAVPPTAYSVKQLRNLFTSDSKYILMGAYVRPDDRIEQPIFFNGSGLTYVNGAVRSSLPDFSFKTNREDNRFEHVMVYQVIDTNQRYIQSLGIGDIYNRPIRVDPHGHKGNDISSYEVTQTDNYLTFGEGGVDDAEDADIILHEYGHAIQNDQAPILYMAGCYTEAAAMAEGFGDYWQASNTRSVSKANGFDPACYAEWDNTDKGTVCRRRVDSKKRYGADITGECHKDGEIWASALWEILTNLGSTEADRRIADQLVLQSHFEMKKMKSSQAVNAPPPTFIEGGIALLKADKILRSKGIFNTEHTAIICTALKTNRNIFVPGCK